MPTLLVRPPIPSPTKVVTVCSIERSCLFSSNMPVGEGRQASVVYNTVLIRRKDSITPQHSLESFQLIIFRARQELDACFEIFDILELPLSEFALSDSVLEFPCRCRTTSQMSGVVYNFQVKKIRYKVSACMCGCALHRSAKLFRGELRWRCHR